MTANKIAQQKISEASTVLQWAVSGDDAAAVSEAKKRARQVAPDCIALLGHVVKVDGYGSVAQRVRSATVLLEVAELLASESKPTGLFHPEGSNDSGDREASL